MSEARELFEALADQLKKLAHLHVTKGNRDVAAALSNTRNAIAEALATKPEPGAVPRTFQDRVHDWMLECFGSEITDDTTERNRRFLEEALELVQANGLAASEAHWLVDYVFGRPAGDLKQEVGGVMVTLAALCNAAKDGVCIDDCAEAELTRVWGKVAKIREKQAAKPKPGAVPELPAHMVGPDHRGDYWMTMPDGTRHLIRSVPGYDGYAARMAEAWSAIAARERARRAGS